MKNTLFYLIIAAVVIYVIYCMKKPANQTPGTTTPTTGTPSNSGLFPSSELDDNPGTADPGEPQPVVTEKTTIENCPYCGTKDAEVTRIYSNGRLVKMDVLCDNKSCPKSYVKIVKSGTLVSDR